MTAWRPLYTRGPTAVFARVIAVVLVVADVALLVSVLAGTGVVRSVTGVVVACGLLALMALFSWRVGRVGVYVSDRGLRVQYVPNSDVVEWADVLRFVVRTRSGAFGAIEAEEIWVVRRDGDPVSTSIMRLVDSPVKDAMRPGAALMGNRDEDFDRALRELEAALASSRETTAGSR